jgi:hypothetical protein
MQSIFDIYGPDMQIKKPQPSLFGKVAMLQSNSLCCQFEVILLVTGDIIEEVNAADAPAPHVMAMSQLTKLNAGANFRINELSDRRVLAWL